MAAEYHGLTGTVYRIDDSNKIGSGGEGSVYDIIGSDELVAKVYHERILNGNTILARRRKIEAMLRLNVNPFRRSNSGKKILQITWPKDALYDEFGRFAGFVMPKVKNCEYTLETAEGAVTRNRIWKDYKWEMGLVVAYNLAYVINDIHRSGVVIGDMNPRNFMVTAEGFVTIIDVDGTAFTADGETYKCSTGFDEWLAPELMSSGIGPREDADFSRESDRFSLAMHIFTLLLNGQNPFEGLRTDEGDTVKSNIAGGYTPFAGSGMHVDDIGTAPTRARILLAAMPREITALFERAFTYNSSNAGSREVLSQRPSAEEWVNVLGKLLIPKQQIATCVNDPSHRYPSTYTGACPWCEMRDVRSVIQPVNGETRAAATVKPARKAGSSGNRKNGASGGTAVAPGGKKQTDPTRTKTDKRKKHPFWDAVGSIAALGALTYGIYCFYTMIAL